ncbi:MAG: MFS transporter [Gammaproteobacteria bacterium]|nr:MFS transporter [Rhodocyclaceae bacterium]MBU3909628.1 MFS transporter [Gammaproteobacteria bacterium]MBU3987943.1 MFS transporter [Gammaproteobacteria bacterium]MBU4005161.1 MFS transporter [Gammaproteobacteria bacterium]MBU4022340.1 MFS transporter [Gammaproteobacteria bacterium]
MQQRLMKWLKLEPGEGVAVAWAFAYFFLLLASYYILRPLRDEMGIAGGIAKLPWLFTGTFIAMLAAVPLFGYITARLPRQRFLPLVYGFFILNLLLFYAAFQVEGWREVMARTFFIWASVFNLFVVSVFWSFMVDLFSSAQGKRLFGLIAAGGTAGAITGPTLTALLVVPVGPINLLLLSALLLAGAVLCIRQLSQWSEQKATAPTQEHHEPLGGSIFAGLTLIVRSPYLLGVALFMLLFTTLATFLYFEQAHIVAQSFNSSAERTRFFALLDLAVNTLTVLTQVLITSRLLTRLGVARTLALVPLLSAFGFALLALTPVLAALAGFQILRRAGEYAITRPAREMLYTVVDRETKYKAKNALDTVVYRGGDALAGWLFAGLKSLGLGLATIAWIAVPIALAWAVVALWLGRQQAKLSRNNN